MKHIIFYSFLVYLGSCNFAPALVNVRAFPQVQPNSQRADLDRYESWINGLIANRNALDGMTPWELSVLVGDIGGFYVQDKMAPQEAISVKKSETLLLGLVMRSLDARLDPSVTDTERPHFKFKASLKPEDHDNNEKIKAYEAAEAAEMQRFSHVQDQVDLKKELAEIRSHTQHYFSLMYGSDPAKAAEGAAILKASGLDDKTIGLLLKPLK